MYKWRRAVANKGEIGLVVTDEKKDQEILLRNRPLIIKANVEGDIGQSNPEDKDVFHSVLKSCSYKFSSLL